MKNITKILGASCVLLAASVTQTSAVSAAATLSQLGGSLEFDGPVDLIAATLVFASASDDGGVVIDSSETSAEAIRDFAIAAAGTGLGGSGAATVAAISLPTPPTGNHAAESYAQYAIQSLLFTPLGTTAQGTLSTFIEIFSALQSDEYTKTLQTEGSVSFNLFDEDLTTVFEQNFFLGRTLGDGLPSETELEENYDVVFSLEAGKEYTLEIIVSSYAKGTSSLAVPDAGATSVGLLLLGFCGMAIPRRISRRS